MGAKNTLQTNYLPLARSKGAHLFTGYEVTHVEKLANGRWRVHCKGHHGAMGMGILVDRVGARPTVAGAACAMLLVGAAVAVRGRFPSLDAGRERHLV